MSYNDDEWAKLALGRKRAAKLEAVLSKEEHNIKYLKALFRVGERENFSYALHRPEFAWLDGENVYALYRALKARAGDG